jgi:tRNA(adenine34) deaminase
MLTSPGNPSQIHVQFMMQAFYEAEQAALKKEVPVGAVIVRNGVIIGRGHNMVEMLQDPTAHAEILAITAACETMNSKYLLDCTLYVTLEPCPMCSGALVWSKMSQVVYGAIDEKCGGCGSLFNICENKNLNHQIEVVGGIMEADCSGLLQGWFREKRK